MSAKVIPQTEPLFTVRSRASVSTNGYDTRGTRSTFRLLNYNAGKHARAGKGTVSSNYTQSLKKLTNPSLGFTDFLLMQYHIDFSEKHQVVSTYGDGNIAYMFGAAPAYIDLTGMLIDDIDNQWFVNFVEMYQTTLRGTMMAQRLEIAELTLPNSRIIGPIVAFSINQTGDRDTDIGFTLRMLIKSYKVAPPMIGNGALTAETNYLMSKTDPNDPLANTLSAGEINTIKQTAIMSPGGYPELAGTASLGTGTYPALSGPPTLKGSSQQPNALLQSYSDYFENAADLISGYLSPVYGLLASITGMITEVTGDIVGFLNGIADPIRSIISQVNSIYTQADQVIGLIERGTMDILAIPETLARDVIQSTNMLINTTGNIIRAPENVAGLIRRSVHSGFMKGNSINPGGGIISGGAVINSGKPYTTLDGAKL